MKFIAHRGYRKRFAENTLPAFSAVIEHSCIGRSLIGIETDIHLTADERIVVMHNTSIENEFGVEVAVSRLSFSLLQEFYRNKNENKVLSIPDLFETLQLINHKTVVCLEIKDADYDLERFTMLLLAELRAYDQHKNDIIISSFSENILQHVHRHASRLSLAYGYIFNTWDAWDNLTRDTRSFLTYAHPWYQLLFQQPARCQSIDVPIHCWTVNEPSDVLAIVQHPCAAQIRAVMTDDISLAEKFGE